jgi:hypothetical protein
MRGARCPPSDLCKPSGSNRGITVEFRYERFDIQNGRSIEEIYVLDMQYAVFNALQLNHRETDGIRSFWRARGKESPGSVTHEGNNVEIEPFASMEIREQDDVGEAVKVFQPRLIFFKHLDGAVNPLSASGLIRYALQRLEGRVYDSNRLEFDHFPLMHSLQTELIRQAIQTQLSIWKYTYTYTYKNRWVFV